MKIALRAQANGMLVCADDALGGEYQPTRPLQANRDQTTPGGWEIFDLLMQDATGAWVPFAFPAPAPIPPTPEPGPEPPSSYPDIRSENFIVYGSDPACLDFPATGTFDSWGLVPGVMTIATTGCGDWPLVAIEDGGEPAQAATLWVLECLEGVWYATGAERLRPEQLNGTKPEGQPATLIGHEWLYDPARWGPMALHNPRPGEVVGLLIVAGSTRSDNQTPCKERTTPIWIRWPDAQGSNPAVLA